MDATPTPSQQATPEETAAPVVTVIVPVYNTELYLDACLDSLVNQTLADIEILCIDDGSKDSSGAMLDARAAKDSRIRVIHQANAGVSHARNVALDNARGEFILFVDSDDYIDLNTCEKLVNIARRDEADIVVFGGVSFPEVPWIDACFNTRDITYRGDSFGALIHEAGSHPLMCNKLYRRALLEEHSLRFNEQLALGEDNAFQFCTFPNAQVISYCRDMFYHYRCDREGSALAEAVQDRMVRVRKHLAVVEYIFGQWRERGFLAGQEERLLSWSTDFLFRDVRFLTREQRLEVAEAYRRLTDELGLMQFHDAQAPFLHDWTDFVRAELPLSEEKPQVSIIALSCYDAEMLQDGFVSLANQYVQDTELLCVDAYPNEESSAKLAELVAADSRARLVSADEALEQAHGTYVLFANMRDTYDWEALRKMLAAAQAEPAPVDVLTVRDRFDRMRTQDMERLLHVLSTDGTTAVAEGEGRTTLTPAELGDRLFGFSSLDASNKLWRTSFAQEQHLNGFNPSSVASALIAAQVILPMPERLMQRGPYEGITEDGARNVARIFTQQMAQLYDDLEGQGLFGAHEHGYVNAFLSRGMCLHELMHSASAERAYLEAFRGVLADSHLLETHNKWWFDHAADYAGAQKLVDEGVEAFMEDAGYARTEQLAGYVNDLEARLASLAKEVKDVRESTSYRLGNKLVRVPRKLAGALRRLLHK